MIKWPLQLFIKEVFFLSISTFSFKIVIYEAVMLTRSLAARLSFGRVVWHLKQGVTSSFHRHGPHESYLVEPIHSLLRSSLSVSKSPTTTNPSWATISHFCNRSSLGFGPRSMIFDWWVVGEIIKVLFWVFVIVSFYTHYRTILSYYGTKWGFSLDWR